MQALKERSHASIIFAPEVVRDYIVGRQLLVWSRNEWEGTGSRVHESATDGGSVVAAGMLEPSNGGPVVEDAGLL